jgi:hypothetical protein
VGAQDDGGANERTTAIPCAEARAFVVSAGQILRVQQPQGAVGVQEGDLNIWNLDDPRERFWGSRTALYHGAHVSVGDQLHSTWPGERALMTIIEDTVGGRRSARGALHHDVVLGRCSQRYRARRYGPEKDTPGCQELIADAIAPFQLGPEHVHDAFNVFAAIGIDADDKFFLDASEAHAGDFVDLRAEIDCLVAIACCPGSALRTPDVRGLEFEVHDEGGPTS